MRSIPPLRAEFVTSAFSAAGCPRWNRVEIALAGRSNVGKSSLLNAIAGIRGLARTSKTPGRTQSLNFFALNESSAIVDLPGYGYAKIPRDEAQRIAAMMREYLARRRHLAAIVILVDARRGPEDQEMNLARAARDRAIGLVVAGTKCDKLRRSERAIAIKRLQHLHAWPILCSSTTCEGIDELRRRIVEFARGDDQAGATIR